MYVTLARLRPNEKGNKTYTFIYREGNKKKGRHSTRIGFNHELRPNRHTDFYHFRMFAGNVNIFFNYIQISSIDGDVLIVLCSSKNINTFSGTLTTGIY